jgi:hypothetical protein
MPMAKVSSNPAGVDDASDVVTFKCRICGAAGHADNQADADARMADHIESHKESGWRP